MNAKAVFLLSIIFVLIFLSPAISATTTTTTIILQPGQTEFTTDAIYLPEGIFQLEGSLNYLNIFWYATYASGNIRDIGIICYLNCNQEKQDCSVYQYCTRLAYGSAGCTIGSPADKPKYNQPLDTENYVNCKFYDPLHPTTTVGYFNRTFKPIYFDVSFSDVSTVVGASFNLKIIIKNSGLFTDSYAVKASVPSQYQNILKIEDESKSFTIGPVYGESYLHSPETKYAYIGMRTLTTDIANVCIDITSVTSPSTHAFSDCKQIKSSILAMTDFGWPGILQIILLATLLFASTKFKK